MGADVSCKQESAVGLIRAPTEVHQRLRKKTPFKLPGAHFQCCHQCLCQTRVFGILPAFRSDLISISLMPDVARFGNSRQSSTRVAIMEITHMEARELKRMICFFQVISYSAAVKACEENWFWEEALGFLKEMLSTLTLGCFKTMKRFGAM